MKTLSYITSPCALQISLQRMASGSDQLSRSATEEPFIGQSCPDVPPNRLPSEKDVLRDDASNKRMGNVHILACFKGSSLTLWKY